MAQTEDTELRDLVIEALEKNGSLAKVRALLRANIFLAFEDEGNNKHNSTLDSILNIPEGILSLSLIHEFLEYCNLRHTMFVYISETRQGKEYTYEGRKKLSETFASLKNDRFEAKEPLLITLIKSLFTKELGSHSHEKNMNKNYLNKMCNKNEQNCTYIVHDESSSSSQSQSDNSELEKNKILLRLPLDNSDTDTSSDSMRDKTSSEYVPNENIIVGCDSDNDSKKSNSESPIPAEGLNIPSSIQNKNNGKQNIVTSMSHSDKNNQPYGSSDSTSYFDVQKKQVNEINASENSVQNKVLSPLNINKSDKSSLSSPKNDAHSATLSNISSIRQRSAKSIAVDENKSKADEVSSEYSYDFSDSPHSIKNGSNSKNNCPEILKDVNNCLKPESLSLINKLNSYNTHHQSNKGKKTLESEENNKNQIISDSPKSLETKSPRYNSDDFSIESIPSISNLSLDFHSD